MLFERVDYERQQRRFRQWPEVRYDSRLRCGFCAAKRAAIIEAFGASGNRARYQPEPLNSVPEASKGD